MSMWAIIIVASVACYALKVSGYVVPPEFMERPKPARVSSLLTVALLAALVATQTLATGQEITPDARIPALMVAAILFAVRVPFILVIIAASATAAIIRALGG